MYKLAISVKNECMMTDKFMECRREERLIYSVEI